MLGFLRPKRRLEAVPRVPPRMVAFEGETMGTTYQVQAVVKRNLDETKLAAQIFDAVDAVDLQMSTWKPESDLSRFNAARVGEWISVSRDLVQVVAAALAISKSTQGAFDITVGAAVNAWGFGPDGAPQCAPDAAPKGVWRELDVQEDPPALRKHVPMYVDLSGIAKGFGVDQICAVLAAHDVTDFLVSIDGETRVSGRKPGVAGGWRVAVDMPVSGTSDVWDVLQPLNCAVATSGDYRRYFDHDGIRYAHTIDPATGQPVHGGAASVTVMMPRCMLADAWATALLVLGPDRGVAIAQARNISALFLFHEGRGIRDVTTGDFSSCLS